MSHFAQVVDGIVTQVIVAERDVISAFPNASSWYQTSYNTRANKHLLGKEPFRGNFAGIGYKYDAVNDVFYAPQPYANWTLNQSTWTWEAPTPMPTDGKLYKWDETTNSWVI